ncbi:MAG: macro domain-containing protein [Clostridia bacterium]
MPLNIVRQDITKMNVDAIVNAANCKLAKGGGVCGAIFDAAGAIKLQLACLKIGKIETGEAVITSGFNLQAKYIIHTAGPIYDVKNHELCEHQLKLSYKNSLNLAKEKDIKSIAFPLISSGTYGYPKNQALIIARECIEEFLLENDMSVYLVIFDKISFEVSRALIGDIEAYIDDIYAGEHSEFSRIIEPFDMPQEDNYCCYSPSPQVSFNKKLSQGSFNNDIFENLDESFADTLFKLIDLKEKTDVEVYKKANIDRKLFSKIRSVKGYVPSKRTIIALCISLELSLKETNELLKCAGYALSHSQKFDVIIEYFIINKMYNIFEINEVLFSYDLSLLGN